MMFLLDLAFAVELIVVSIGAIFLIWAYRNEGKCIFFAKSIGFILIFFALAAILCTSYYGFKYWAEGYFNSLTIC